MLQCDVTRKKSAQKRSKQRLSGDCAMSAYLALTCTYLVSNSTYFCKLSLKHFPTGTDHGDICLAGVWLHKERFLRTSSIVITMSLLSVCNALNKNIASHGGSAGGV